MVFELSEMVKAQTCRWELKQMKWSHSGKRSRMRKRLKVCHTLHDGDREKQHRAWEGRLAPAEGDMKPGKEYREDQNKVMRHIDN